MTHLKSHHVHHHHKIHTTNPSTFPCSSRTTFFPRILTLLTGANKSQRIRPTSKGHPPRPVELAFDPIPLVLVEFLYKSLRSNLSSPSSVKSVPTPMVRPPALTNWQWFRPHLGSLYHRGRRRIILSIGVRTGIIYRIPYKMSDPKRVAHKICFGSWGFLIVSRHHHHLRSNVINHTLHGIAFKGTDSRR